MVSVAPVLLRRPGSSPLVQRVRALPLPALAGVAAGLALVGGGLTSLAQTVLPDALAPSANSSSGWTLLVVLLVALLAARPGRSALLGPIAFVGLTLGYQVVSTLRGFPTSEAFFLIAGLIVGPCVGVAAAWLRRRGWRPAVGAAVLGGIGLGEGVYGLTVVAASTAPAWWIAIASAATALVAVVAVRRAGRWWALAPVGALAVGAAFLVAYSSL